MIVSIPVLRTQCRSRVFPVLRPRRPSPGSIHVPNAAACSRGFPGASRVPHAAGAVVGSEPLPLLDVTPASTVSSDWAELDRRARGTRFFSIVSKGVLNSPAVTRMAFWSINPYIGCAFGCAYCYARDTHRWTVERATLKAGAPNTAHEAATLAPVDAFERRILVKEGAAAVLARTLHPSRHEWPAARDRHGDRSVSAGRAASFRVTRVTAREPAAPVSRPSSRHHHQVTADHARHGAAGATRAAARRHREPIAGIDRCALAAPARASHTGTARTHPRNAHADHRRGCAWGSLIAPILPGITDGRDALRALMLAAKDAGAAWAVASPLRMGPATRRTLLPWLARERPDLARRYARHYGSGQAVSKAYAEALSQRMSELRDEIGSGQTRRDRMNGAMEPGWADGVVDVSRGPRMVRRMDCHPERSEGAKRPNAVEGPQSNRTD